MKTKLVLMFWLMAIGLAAVESTWAFYNPLKGRWLSRDPIAEKGNQNLYAITDNACIKEYDYLGLCPVGDTKSECAVQIGSASPASAAHDSAGLAFIDFVDDVQKVHLASKLALAYLPAVISDSAEAWLMAEEEAMSYASTSFAGLLGEAAIDARSAYQDHSIGIFMWTRVTEYQCECAHDFSYFGLWTKWEEQRNSGWVRFNEQIPSYTVLDATSWHRFISRLHATAKAEEICDQHMIDYSLTD